MSRGHRGHNLLKGVCFRGPGEWPYVNILVLVSGGWPDVNNLAAVPWRYIYYKRACSIHHQAVMQTYRRVVLQRYRPTGQHSRAPRRRRLSHSHSSNRTITSHTSHTDPRGSVYQTDHQVPPNSPPTWWEVWFRRPFKTSQVKRQQFQFQQIY